MEKSSAAIIPARRPWFRLHLSTWLTLPLGLVVAVLVVFPGELGDSRQSYWPWVGCDQVVVHGWPLPYLWRSAWDWPSYAQKPTPNLPSLPWKVWDSVEKFRCLPLIVDLAFAGAGLAIFIGLVECRRRRRFRASQFSLRELLGCSLVVAAALGWWAQRRAFDRELTDRFERVAERGPQEGRLAPRLPLWLRMFAGDDRLTWLGINGPNAPIRVEWDLSRRQDIQFIVDHFPDQTTVEMNFRPSSEDAVAVASIHSLEKISCDNLSPDEFTRVFTQLERHPHLREINAGLDFRSVFDDVQLVPIATLPKLESLVLYTDTSHLTERGFANFKNCRNLTELRLDRARLTKDTLNSLCGLTGLRRLSLIGGRFIRADLSSFRELNALEELELSETNLLDADALKLRTMRNLRRLAIDHTRMTKRGVTDLLDPATEFAVRLDQISFGVDSLDDELIAAIKRLPGLHSINVRIFDRSDAGPNYAQLISKLKGALPDREIVEMQREPSVHRDDRQQSRDSEAP